ISQDAASQINAARHITANARDTLSNQGQITAGQNLTVNSNSLTQSGKLLAGGSAQLNSGTLSNSGLVQGNALAVNSTTLSNGGSLLSGTTLNVQTQDFTQTGSAGAKGKTDITASHSLTNSGSLVTDEALTLKAGNVTQNGTLSGGKGLTLTAGTLTTGKSSLTHSGDALSVQASTATLGGEFSAGGDMQLNADQLSTVAGSQVQSGNNLSITAREASLAGTQAARNALAVNASGALSHSGNSSADAVTLSAPTLNNSGTVVASTLRTQSQTLTNSGMLQGDSLLALDTDTLNNLQDGTLYSASALKLDIPDITSHGVIASDAAVTVRGHNLINSGQVLGSALSFELGSLSNSGALQSDSLLTLNGGTLSNGQSGTLYSAGEMALNGTDISNSGLITSDSGLSLNATALTNPGKIIGSTLNVNAGTLTGEGLLQGANALTLAGGNLSQGAAGRWLTAGDLSVDGTTLTTAGTTQGQQLNIDAESWNNAGSVLATGDLNSTLSGSLLNSGEVMSQGDLTLTAPTLTNHGNLLAAGNMSLSGQQFTSDGTLQGGTLGLMYNGVNNQGTVIGLGGLTLNSAGALTNSGDLLSQRDLSVKATDVTNSGRLQGENITLDGSSLTNSGAIQSALGLALTLSGDMQAITGSKITALGDARIAGKALGNQGLVSAKTLAIQGDSLDNSGEISGVNGLGVTLSGSLQQQGKLLTGGKLAVKARDISNGGQLQGGDTQINAGSLTNSGRIQGDSGLTLTLLNALTSQAGGIILSQNALTITAPVLTSDGTIQGNGKTTLSATTQTRNGGKILSGGDLTLSTPDYSGAGWLQATNLVLDVARLESHGTVIAANQARLTGNSLTNGGTFQAAMLDVNYQAMSNSGTLLGNQSLTLKGNTLNNAGGRMFSGGDMLTDVTALSGAGQLVALGNLTLKLANSFSAQGVIVSNKQLSVTSQGDITNAGTLQGKGITLNAKGKLSNNGQLTAGSGTTSLSGSQIAMNASGSLQAGGDVSLNSLGNITLDGFTGTAGSLVLTAAGSVVNTALLYAGNNLSLFANSIQNLRGDILAGNNLVMQKDASGAANAEVSNRSGTIESQHGSVTVNTGSFYNGYTAFESQTTTTAGSSEGTLYPLPSSEYRFGVDEDGEYLMVLTSNRDEYRLLVGDKTTVTVSATGNAGRIASGGDLTITARDITNEASALLADGTVRLNAGTLNNMSYQAGTSATETVFTRDDSRRYVSGAYDWIGYRPTSQSTLTPDGETYRAVILAGGNVILNVSQNLSNTNVTPWGEGTGGTQAAPSLNTAGNGSIGDVVSALSLEDGSDAAITAPDWQDTSDDASQAISGGTSLSPDGMDSSLYPLPSGNNGYFVPSTDPDSPYLITVNPKLDGLGQLDPSLFGDLYKLLGMTPGSAPTETSSRYTDINQFLGSSYMLGKLGFDPENDYRFLGDAAFDTRYVSNYVLNQTGTRYINGLGSDLDQMRYLMDSAADAQRGLGLTFGVALTADQVAALDHSILWWQTATINGQTVMVPKVYLSPKDTKVHNGSVISGNNVQLTGGSLTNNGSSLIAQNGLSIDSSNSISNLNAGLISAGGGLDLHAMGDISNISSAITGKTVQLESTGGSIISETLSRQNTMDLPGLRGQGVALTNTLQGNTATIQSQEGMVMSAGQDIHLKGAQTASGGEQLLIAGRDVTVESNQVRQGAETTGDNSWRGFSHETVANQNSTLTSGGNLNVVAGRDINAGGAGLAAEKNVGIQAGRDVNLSADGSSQRDFAHTRDKTVIDESVRQQGTEISSGGNTIVIAGRDVNSEAARVTASGDIGVAAGRDVNLTTATESDYHYKEQTKTKKGFLSKKTTHTIEEDSATREAGSLLSGDNVQVSAGNNLLVKGSSVVADDAVNLSAGNNVDIVAATNTDSSWRFKEVKKSGLMGTGGIGITVGSSKTTHDLREAGTTQSQSFSTVGSTGGSVVISAGNQAHIGGADLIAGKDLAVIGDSVLIDPGHDKRSRDETFEQKKSGLTLALSGTVGSAINNAVTSAQDTNEESDGRLKALQATKTALSGVQAGQAAAVASATGDPNAMGVSLSLTTQKSKSQQHAQSDAVSGSTL
ncbi:hemagglutinin repeat-containing protein, partial [Dryocola clanedunensis]